MQSKKIILAALLLAFMAVFAWRFRGDKGGTAANGSGNDAPRKNLLRQWSKGEFDKLKVKGKIESDVGKLIGANYGPVAVTPLQSNALRSAVLALLETYSMGGFAEYARYRLPGQSKEHVKWDTNEIHRIRKILPNRQTMEQALRQAGQPVDTEMFSYLTNDLEAFKLWYESAKTARVKNENASLYCMDCWKAVSFDGASLVVDESREGVPPLMAEVMQRDNLGGHSPTPAFAYEPSPGQVAKRDGRVVHARIAFGVKTDREIKAYPVYAQWYWVPEYELWLPTEIHFPIADKDVEYLF
jgi:hypothetical protein